MKPSQKFEYELFNYLKSFMIGSNWEDEKTPEQARAMFTTFCFIANIDADTMDCGAFLWILYTEAIMKDIMSYEEFEAFMVELIV